MKAKQLKKPITLILALVLAAVLGLSLSACGQSSSGTSKPEETQGAGGSSAAQPETTAAQPETTAAQPETTATQPETKVPEAPPADEVELTVFAAASMTETLEEIKGLYEAAHPGVKITYNFDSSGTLKTQIQEGAACDLFISAAAKQMNELDITADPEVNTEGLDFVLADTRLNLLENKVNLVVPEGNPKNITSFDQLAEALKAGGVLMAMGNSDVPVGQYTQKILDYYGLSEEELAQAGALTYGSNVKEVTTQVAEGSVDCGVVYATDAFSAGLEAVDSATEEMCGKVIYPAAVLNKSAHPEEAKAFLEYLTGKEASDIFAAVGFTPLS